MKYRSTQTKGGQVITFYPTGEQFGNTYKRTATGKIATKGFRATGLFPCDKNIFRPHDFPLTSENTEAAPVKRPALVKTSDQPSFSSVNFSPFTSAEAFRASDISAVPSLNLQPNLRGGTIKKTTSSSSRNFVGATQKKKIKQATKSKTNRPASNALLGPSKRRKRVVCRDPTPSDTLSDSDTDLTVLSLTIRQKKRNKTLSVSSLLVVSLKTTMYKSGYDVRNISDGCTHFVLVWRNVLFVSLVRDKHRSVLPLCL